MKRLINKPEDVVREELEGIAHTLLLIAGKVVSDCGYSWVPVVGPIIGATIAVFLSAVIFP